MTVAASLQFRALHAALLIEQKPWHPKPQHHSDCAGHGSQCRGAKARLHPTRPQSAAPRATGSRPLSPIGWHHGLLNSVTAANLLHHRWCHAAGLARSVCDGDRAAGRERGSGQQEGTVVPRPIALLATLSVNGTPNAAPYSFFDLMGNDPPVLAPTRLPGSPDWRSARDKWRPSRWRKLAGRLAAGQDRTRGADERRHEAKQEPNCRPWAKAERCSREHPSRPRAQPFRDLVPWSEGWGSEVALIFSPALTALSPRRQPAGIEWSSSRAFGPR
jgi:hypothetical protein